MSPSITLFVGNISHTSDCSESHSNVFSAENTNSVFEFVPDVFELSEPTFSEESHETSSDISVQGNKSMLEIKSKSVIDLSLHSSSLVLTGSNTGSYDRLSPLSVGNTNSVFEFVPDVFELSEPTFSESVILLLLVVECNDKT
jgi:hypothetical protein